MKRFYSILSLLLCFFAVQVFYPSVSSAQSSGIIVPGSLYKLDAADKEFLSMVRKALSTKDKEADLQKRFDTALRGVQLPREVDGVALALYQPKNARIVVVRRGNELGKILASAVASMRKHKRFSSFSLKETGARLQIDLFSDVPKPFDINTAVMDLAGDNRFEFGVDGLVVRPKDKKETLYFLPGDAFIRSRLGFRQLDRHLRHELKAPKEAELVYKKFHTYSFISYKNDWLELYRGYPYPWVLTKKDIQSAAFEGARHLLRYQTEEGKFLYYYNPARDSLVDHEHPKRDPEKDGYYNIVRHLSSVPLLIRYYHATKDSKVLSRIEKALWYAASFTKKYPLPDGSTGAYVYQYKKSKLGAQGVFLHAMLLYERETKDRKFAPLIEQVTRHILQQVQDSGEFMYYAIIDGKPVTKEQNPQYFDFYYAGEALLGLASFVQGREADPLVQAVKEKIHKALHFLINERPKKYAGLFPSLPMDAWVGMAIAELWAIPDFQKAEYAKLAFDNADKVIEQTYTFQSALYPDYAGSYFYTYGDNSYPDGSRTEGVIGALKLAQMLKDDARVKRYIQEIQLNIRALYFLVNTDQSSYSVPNPQKTIGGIRFKQTRQWFRIDTISHVANVFFDFLPYWNDEADKQNFTRVVEGIQRRYPLMTPVR